MFKFKKHFFFTYTIKFVKIQRTNSQMKNLIANKIKKTTLLDQKSR